jgi:hypothetical protein
MDGRHDLKLPALAANFCVAVIRPQVGGMIRPSRPIVRASAGAKRPQVPFAFLRLVAYTSEFAKVSSKKA